MYDVKFIANFKVDGNLGVAIYLREKLPFLPETGLSIDFDYPDKSEGAFGGKIGFWYWNATRSIFIAYLDHGLQEEDKSYTKREVAEMIYPILAIGFGISVDVAGISNIIFEMGAKSGAQNSNRSTGGGE